MDGEGEGCHGEESERGVGAGVNTTMLFATLQVVVLTDTARTTIRSQKKNHELVSM